MDSMIRGQKSYETGYMADPISEGVSREAMGESEAEYGPCDCYCDCMTAFRWECKEAAECASACGLSTESE